MIWGCVSSAYASTSFEASKKTYVLQLEKIDAQALVALDKAMGDYLASLRRIKSILTRRGDLDNVLAVNNEIENCEKLRKVDESTAASIVVIAAQARYNESIEQVENRKRNALILISRQWITHLGRLQANLTREGRLDEATRVRDEARSVSQEILALKANLARDAVMALASCPKCSGAGEQSTSCTRCSSTGKCKFCDGSGVKPGLNGSRYKCPLCAGKGACSTCEGSGKQMQTCSGCKGKKKIFVASANAATLPNNPEITMSNIRSTVAASSCSNSSGSDSSGLDEYIESMGKLFSAYKEGDAAPEDLNKVTGNPGQYVGKLLVSEARIMSSFPRCVIVAVESSGNVTGVELIPHSHAVGKQATALFESAGKGARIRITFGVVNDRNFTLFESLAL